MRGGLALQCAHVVTTTFPSRSRSPEHVMVKVALSRRLRRLDPRGRSVGASRFDHAEFGCKMLELDLGFSRDLRGVTVGLLGRGLDAP